MATWHFFPISKFESYVDRWDSLNLKGFNIAVLSSDFVRPLLECFATGLEKLAMYGDLENPGAMAVITKTKFGVWETLQPSQAPLGLWLQDKTISQSLLIKELLRDLPFPTLLVGVTQQDPQLLKRPDADNNLSTLDYIQTARVAVQGSFDDYWSARSKNLRQNHKRQRNGLERNGIKTVLKLVTEPAEMEQAIVEYGRLESGGWKNTGGTAIHIENDQGRFYLAMLKNFCSKQNGIVFQYFYDDMLVATDLCIKDANSLIILKTTYDETITTSSPAMLMRQDAFEYIFNHQLVANIEFYGKVMDWHTKWSNEIRTMYHINYSLALFKLFKN